MIHTDAGFAAAWGAFPVLTAYAAQTGRLALARRSPLWAHSPSRGATAASARRRACCVGPCGA